MYFAALTVTFVLIFFGTSVWLVRRTGLPLTAVGKGVLVITGVCFVFTVAAAVASGFGATEASIVARMVAICTTVVFAFFVWITAFPSPLFANYSEIFSEDQRIQTEARRRFLRNRVIKK